MRAPECGAHQCDVNRRRFATARARLSAMISRRARCVKLCLRPDCLSLRPLPAGLNGGALAWNRNGQDRAAAFAKTDGAGALGPAATPQDDGVAILQEGALLTAGQQQGLPTARAQFQQGSALPRRRAG